MPKRKLQLDRIYNMDCLEGMKQIEPKSVSLIVTDPPYWHHKSPGKPYSQRNQANTASKFATSDLYNAEGSMMAGMSDFDGDHINELLDACKSLMKIFNGYFFCSEAQVPYYCIWAEKNKLMSTILVWEKPVSIINKNRFSQNLEYIVRIYDYGTALNRVDNNALYNRVFHDAPVKGKEKLHPTQKPISIAQKLLQLSSKEGDLILDPFMGSATTAIACIKENRRYIGFEISKEYYGIAQNRIENEKEIRLS